MSPSSPAAACCALCPVATSFLNMKKLINFSEPKHSTNLGIMSDKTSEDCTSTKEYH